MGVGGGGGGGGLKEKLIEEGEGRVSGGGWGMEGGGGRGGFVMEGRGIESVVVG